MDRNDLEITSYCLMDGGITLQVRHIPTGLQVEESQRYPDMPLLNRLEKLVTELALKVDVR
jgi:hypothetical protein